MPEINLDYSGRDYTASLEWLYSLLRQYLPEYTDFNHSDAGIAMIRLLARQLDQANFYMDEVFAEGFLETAQFKQSLIELGKLVGILPKMANAASTDLVITRTTEPYYLTQIINIPKGIPITRVDSLPYVCLDDIVLPVGTNTTTVELLQGEYKTLTLTAADFDYYDLSNHLKFNLGKNVAARTVRIIHGPGEIPWTEVESFYRSLPTDYHYQLELHADEFEGEYDTVFLVLGDGKRGSSFPNADMTVSFVVTEGPRGNCGSGVITVLPEGDYSVMVTATNPTPATGGSLAETTNEFRSRLPLAVRVQDRGVNSTDYQDLIRGIPGVGDCNTVDRKHTELLPWEYISIFVVPSGGGLLSSELENAILNKLMEKGGLGGWVGRYLMESATPVVIPISCRINIAAGYSENTVKAALASAISGLFTVRYGIIGSTFSFSRLNLVAARVAGINWIEFDTPTSDISLNYNQYPVLGNLTMTVIS